MDPLLYLDHERRLRVPQFKLVQHLRRDRNESKDTFHFCILKADLNIGRMNDVPDYTKGSMGTERRYQREKYSDCLLISIRTHLQKYCL